MVQNPAAPNLNYLARTFGLIRTPRWRIGGHLWLAGSYDDGGSELPLVEHR
ncbi:MAG TPA: hypothetical protein VFI65_20260 [Streptosporangiaceae bacterium]|nr:hypothetical protein [Streptosporangiaceae bacterium]